MAELDPNIMIDISTKIAGIDERTKAFEKNADHRHRNIMAAIENFVPRREIDGMIADTRHYAEGLAKETKLHCDANREIVVGRVDNVETALNSITGNQTFIKRAVIGALITGAIGLLFGFVTWVAPLVLAALRAG